MVKPSSWTPLCYVIYMYFLSNLHAYISVNHCFFSDHIPPISEVISGDTKIVTEFKRNEEGKLLKVVLSNCACNNKLCYDAKIQQCTF